MRRVRPYIPIPVRLKVAERQVMAVLSKRPRLSIWWPIYKSAEQNMSQTERLNALIGCLAEALGDVLELDHDPALILREHKPDRRKPKAAWYIPNANDPDYLVYRPLQDHQHKTTGRKAGAERTVTSKGSDIWLKSKFARLERKKKVDTSDIPETRKGWFKRAKVKIPARANPWPKRKLRGKKSR